jgi:Undecaprenyl-phosphate glucose phosphotransferase
MSVRFSRTALMDEAPARYFRAGAEEYYVIALRCVDAIAVMCCGVGAFVWRHGDIDMSPAYWGAIILAVVGLQAVAEPFALYADRVLDRPATAAGSAMAAWVVVLSGLIALAYFLKISDVFSRTWGGSWAFSVAVAMMGARMVAAHHLSAAIAAGRLAVRVAIIGDERDCRRLHAELAGVSGTQLVGVIAPFPSFVTLEQLAVDLAAATPAAGPAAEGEGGGPAPTLGGLPDLVDLCARFDIDELAFFAPVDRLGPATEVLALLRAAPARVRLCLDPALGSAPLAIAEPLGVLPTVALFTPPLRGGRRLAKEIMDVLLGAVLLLAALPIMMVAAAAIHLEGAGPVLFPQARGGFGGKTFTVYKLRTMRPCAALDADALQAEPGDPRVTRVGRLLRRYSIDELPQLWNVLKRDMSLVGPRPHALPHDDHYGRLIDIYVARRKMKPGLTGWAQVNGLRGRTARLADMEARVRHDLYYIENWSIGLDLRILVMTMYRVFADRNAC